MVYSLRQSVVVKTDFVNVYQCQLFSLFILGVSSSSDLLQWLLFVDLSCVSGSVTGVCHTCWASAVTALEYGSTGSSCLP